MKILILLAAVAVALFAFSQYEPSTEKIIVPNAQKTPPLIRVATVEGKSFFVETETAEETYYNWTEASIFCKGMGMRLATIDSKSQFDALNAATVPGFLDKHYWTSGREPQNLQQFLGNKTHTIQSSELLYLNIWNVHSVKYLNCALFRKFGHNSQLVIFPCTGTASILCNT